MMEVIIAIHPGQNKARDRERLRAITIGIRCKKTWRERERDTVGAKLNGLSIPNKIDMWDERALSQKS